MDSSFLIYVDVSFILKDVFDNECFFNLSYLIVQTIETMISLLFCFFCSWTAKETSSLCQIYLYIAQIPNFQKRVLTYCERKVSLAKQSW